MLCFRFLNPLLSTFVHEHWGSAVNFGIYRAIWTRLRRSARNIQAEVIRRNGPWKSIDVVEIATLDWVDWYNNRRILEPIG